MAKPNLGTLRPMQKKIESNNNTADLQNKKISNKIKIILDS